MSTTLQNSIWPNAGGTLGEIKTQIPDGVTTKWPDGDALVGNFVYKDGKLVGFVDTKALITNEAKSTTIPYDCVNINLENILEDTLTIIPGERCKSLTTVYGDVVKFLTPKLKELLGETKFELYFENDTKKLIIHTDRISDDMVTELENLLSETLPQTIEPEKYNHNMEISWKDINKYAGFTNMPALYAAYPDFQSDLTSDGGWIYPLTNLKYIDNTQIGVGDGHWRAFRNFKANYAYFYVPNLTRIDSQFLAGDIKAPPEVEIYAPKLTTSGRIVSDSGNWVKKVKAYLPLLSKGNHAFHFNYKLTIFEGELPSLSNGYNAFNKTQLNKESALRILNSIPAYASGSHPLTIGIHIDHQNDEEILAAIANAEAKGWTLTVQWNGTATSTASVMRFGQLIYAKEDEIEQPDGTTERMLDWGHYVTNWEERGYEQFRSLESAYEYFGLEMNN